ncbi:MAG TPA: hypothetical protein V6D15_20910 [Oculatellaceae cyanobacterium]|jgi:hypothetical protein
MLYQNPPIYFYIPKEYYPKSIPKSANEDWKGFGIGIYAWTLQTYLHLQANNFPCKLTDTLPDEGIVLIHRNSFTAFQQQIKPGKKLLLICLKAEWEPYPYAQLHVVQNPLETKYIADSYYIPHWTQPGLIKRDRTRDDKFENIAFFGFPENLAPELTQPSWQAKLQDLGLNWYAATNRDLWNNYSTIDTILAVRSFDPTSRYLSRNYISKPATKLYNAWCAGVPAILGYESAFQAERQSELDYLEVSSLTDVIDAIQRLRDDYKLRQAMVENGDLRAEKIKPDKTVAKWHNFLTNVAIPAYNRWCLTSKFEQEIFFQRRYVLFKVNRAQNKLRLLALEQFTRFRSEYQKKRV